MILLEVKKVRFREIGEHRGMGGEFAKGSRLWWMVERLSKTKKIEKV